MCDVRMERAMELVYLEFPGELSTTVNRPTRSGDVIHPQLRKRWSGHETMEERPRPPDAEPQCIARIIENYFSIREVDMTSISPLPGYEDRNYLFAAVTGDPPISEKYVFKISNVHYTKNQEVVRATHAVMRYAAEKGIPCPLPVPSTSGDDLVVVNGEQLGQTGARNCDHIIRVFCYLPGVPLTEIALYPRLLYTVGEIAGKLDVALKSFQNPTLQRDGREFDLERSLELRAVLPAMQNLKHRGIAEKILNMFENHVIPCLPQLTHGLIHSDLHDLNIVVQMIANGSYEVSGVLDFADCFYSYYVYELGTLMAELMPKRKDPVQWVCPLVAGYQHTFPLNPTEFGCLYYVVLTRLCLSATLCYTNYQQDPSNTYLLSGVDGFWELAEELLSTPKEEVDIIWRKALLDTSFCEN